MFGAIFVLMAVIAIYWVGNKAYGKSVGLLAALFFGVFSSGPMVEGGTVNLETLMHLPLILAVGFIIDGSTTGRLKWYLLAGFCGAMAALVKQVGGIIFFAFLCSEIHKGWRMKQGLLRYFILGAGAIVPTIGILLFYALHGYALHEIYDSILGSNFRYLQRGYEYRSIFFYFFSSVKTILLENSLLWIGTIFSTTILVFRIVRGKSELTGRILIWWAFWSFGVLWISGTFFAHYFLQIIAPFSLLAAYGVVTTWKLVKTISPLSRLVVRGTWVAFLMVTIILFIKIDYKYFFSYNPVEQTVFQYKGLDSIFDQHGYGAFGVVQQEIASYIRNRTDPSDTIYVWGVSPQIYYLAQRRAATRYRNNFNISLNVTNHPAKELQAYAPVVMEEIRKSPPAYIVQIFRLEDFPELQGVVRDHYQIEMNVEVPGTPFNINLYRRL
jgi:hypothetical protein